MNLKNLLRSIRRLFSRQKYEKVHPEKIKSWSEETFSKGFFQFFTPHYIFNGVDLRVSDRQGLIDYAKRKKRENLEEKTEVFNSPLDKYCWFRIPKEFKEYESKLLEYLLEGFKLVEEYLSGLTNLNYNSLNLRFSPAYSRQRIYSHNNQLNFEFGI